MRKTRSGRTVSHNFAGSGSVTINGLRQRFVILKNERKHDGSNQPDYVLMSSDEPEVGEARQGAGAGSRRPPR